MAVLREKMSDSYSSFRAAFVAIDHDHSGFIDAHELRELLAHRFGLRLAQASEDVSCKELVP